MAQGVRADAEARAAAPDVARDEPLHAAAGQPASARVDEQRVTARQRGPVLEPRAERRRRFLVERDDAGPEADVGRSVLEGEDEVVGGERNTVVPDQVGLQTVAGLHRADSAESFLDFRDEFRDERLPPRAVVRAVGEDAVPAGTVRVEGDHEYASVSRAATSVLQKRSWNG